MKGEPGYYEPKGLICTRDNKPCVKGCTDNCGPVFTEAQRKIIQEVYKDKTVKVCTGIADVCPYDCELDNCKGLKIQSLPSTT